MFMFFLSLGVLAVTGCAAVQTQRDYGDLKLFCYPGEPVFLETQPKTAYVAVRAPTEITGLKEAVEQKLTLKGIHIVDSPEQADISYVVALYNASVQETAAADVQKFGGPNAAHSLGAGTGIATLSGGNLTSVGVGTAASFVGGSVVNATINRWVTLNDLRIRADVQVREKLPAQTVRKQKGKAAAPETVGAGDGYAYHQTYIVVRAQKVNLTWDECAAEVKARLVKEITAAI
jgi:hypothetical protein